MRHLVRIIEAARASPWAPLAVRAALVGCALLLLAWVGATASSAAPALASEAGADPALPAHLVGAPPTSAEAPTLAVVLADAAPPERAPVADGPRGVHARASPEDPVHLNRASADDLRRLPGCGEKRAEAILALRRRLGRFSRVEELLRVKGVGRTTLRKWRPLVRLDAPDGGP